MGNDDAGTLRMRGRAGRASVNPVLFHPDYDRRLRNLTGSCESGPEPQAAGPSPLAGFTAGGDFSPRPEGNEGRRIRALRGPVKNTRGVPRYRTAGRAPENAGGRRLEGTSRTTGELSGFRRTLTPGDKPS